ncbi:MAG: GAF domain-containing protein [Candidatus Dadabacteria bacterium]|nr:GAF domain-containing protein [Candidatus Dadabacteria bacterium]
MNRIKRKNDVELEEPSPPECAENEIGALRRRVLRLEESLSRHRGYSEKLRMLCSEIENLINDGAETPVAFGGMPEGDVLSTEHTELIYNSLRRYEKMNRYEKIIRIITQSVHRSLDPGEVINIAVEEMNKHIESAENVCIYMVEGDNAVLKSFRGYPSNMMELLGAIPRPKGFTWKTIIDSKPIHCPDVDEDTLIGPKGREIGTKSYVCMPICHAGKAMGSINVNSVRKHAFGKDELHLLEKVAGQIESAINNARQAEELRKSKGELRDNIAKLRRKNRYERVINTVTMSLHQSLRLGEVFENAVESLHKEVREAEHVLIYLVESGKQPGFGSGSHAVLKAQRGHERSFLDKVERIPYPRGATWKTIVEGRARFIPDGDDDPSLGQAARDLGIASYVSMPLKLEDDTVGCIHIHSFKKGAFTKDHLKLLEIVAKQLETAINNARKTEALRKSEEALRKTKDDLEERVRERTSELQKSNTLLIKEILERRCVENELKQSLAEKDVLLKEIHHRVKNNLQIISSLLNLQSRKIKDRKARSSFLESNNRIQSIATLHEQLYRSKDLSRIDFGAHIRNMTNHLLRSYGVRNSDINVEIDAGQVYLNINTAIPCGLIVNELVSNAIKHGFAGRTKGNIKIGFGKDGERCVLTVANDGERFPEDVDINASATLGLELVTSLARQLKGSVGMSSGDVTEFRLEFRS